MDKITSRTTGGFLKALIIWLIPVMAMAIDFPPGFEIVSQDNNRIEIKDLRTGYIRPYWIGPSGRDNDQPAPPEIATEDSIRPWYYFERLTTLPWYADIETGDLNHSGTEEIYGWYMGNLYLDTLTSPWNFEIINLGPIGAVVPRGFGDTDGDNFMELLTYSESGLSLFESSNYYGYPDSLIWFINQNCYCIINQKLGDIDNNGLDEIMFYPNGRTWVGYQIYGINDQHEFEYKAAIRFGDYVNDYVGEPSWGDLDGDGRIEIFAGGIHGEIIIFENIGNDLYDFVWQDYAGGPSAYSTEFIGDTDHDGINEFMVASGGMEGKAFSIFEATGDNRFELVYRQEFSGFGFSDDDMVVGNFTGESDSEIALCIGSDVVILRSSANNTWDEILRFRASNNYSYIRKFKTPGSRDIILNPKTSTQVLTDVLRVASSYYPGDVNADGVTNGLDMIYLVNYIKYHPDPIPEPRLRADANGDCLVNLLDVTFMVNYYKGRGPAPEPGWCEY